MSAPILHIEDSTTYPGAYEPPFKVTQTARSGRRAPEGINVSSSIVEFTDYYKIQLPLHGLKREDIFITIENRMLTILSVQKEGEIVHKGKNLHRSGSNHIYRKIYLPENADADFATAEYKDGELSVFIFKTHCPNHLRKVYVIVY